MAQIFLVLHLELKASDQSSKPYKKLLGIAHSLPGSALESLAGGRKKAYGGEYYGDKHNTSQAEHEEEKKLYKDTVPEDQLRHRMPPA